MRRNHGPGKRYPGRLTCILRVKEVPAFVCCSPKGGISSDLLMQMLKRMDALSLFRRLPGGPLPFILLDGHGSRLNLPFLEYINYPDHIWKVCFGLPNGTAIWQVGDLPEQNGSWKMATKKYTIFHNRRSAVRKSPAMPGVRVRESTLAMVLDVKS